MTHPNQPRFLSRPARALLVGGAALLLAGCMGRGEETEVALEPENPDLLYNQVLALMQAGDASDAGKKFEEISKQHPYSDYSRRSLMMSAYLNFRRAKYQEAVNDAQRFVTLYPTNPD